MHNCGDYLLESTCSYENGKLYHTVSFDEKSCHIIIKIVNPSSCKIALNIEIDDIFSLEGNALVTVLTHSDIGAVNSLENKINVIPLENTLENAHNTFIYSFQEHSFTVIRIQTKQ